MVPPTSHPSNVDRTEPRAAAKSYTPIAYIDREGRTNRPALLRSKTSPGSVGRPGVGDPQRSRAPVNDCERCAVDTTLLVPGGQALLGRRRRMWQTVAARSCHTLRGSATKKHTPPRAPRKWCNLHHFHPGSRRMKRRIFVATTKSLDTTWRFRHVVICYAGRCVGFPTSDIIIAAPRATHTLQARLWSRRTFLDLGFLQRLTNTLQAGAWQFRLIMRSR